MKYGWIDEYLLSKKERRKGSQAGVELDALHDRRKDVRGDMPWC